MSELRPKIVAHLHKPSMTATPAVKPLPSVTDTSEIIPEPQDVEGIQGSPSPDHGQRLKGIASAQPARPVRPPRPHISTLPPAPFPKALAAVTQPAENFGRRGGRVLTDKVANEGDLVFPVLSCALGAVLGS